jgi:hypothetical protein
LFLFLGALAESKINEVNKSNDDKCKQKKEQADQVKVNTFPIQNSFFDEGSVKEDASNYSLKVTPIPETISKTDTIPSSISKYNYLFYFIYKYKFENKFGIDQIERLITD